MKGSERFCATEEKYGNVTLQQNGDTQFPCLILIRTYFYIKLNI